MMWLRLPAGCILRKIIEYPDPDPYLPNPQTGQVGFPKEESRTTRLNHMSICLLRVIYI